MRQELDSLWPKANGSCSGNDKPDRLGSGLTLLNSLRDNPEREDLGFGHCFRGGRAICKDAGELGDLRQPATVLFSFAVEVEFHLRTSSVHKAILLHLPRLAFQRILSSAARPTGAEERAAQRARRLQRMVRRHATIALISLPQPRCNDEQGGRVNDAGSARLWQHTLVALEFAQSNGGGDQPSKEHQEKEPICQSVGRSLAEGKELKDESESNQRKQDD